MHLTITPRPDDDRRFGHGITGRGPSAARSTMNGQVVTWRKNDHPRSGIPQGAFERADAARKDTLALPPDDVLAAPGIPPGSLIPFEHQAFRRADLFRGRSSACCGRRLQASHAVPIQLIDPHDS